MIPYINTFVAGLVLILIIFIWRNFHRRLARQLGCLPPTSYPHKEPILGLDLLLNTIQLTSQRRNIPAIAERFILYGKTFQNVSLGSTVLNTIDPENLHAIYGSEKCSHWGVEPVRLAAMEPFCGKGFITTDGAVWEHSRTLLKPTFMKSNISDLSYIQAALAKVIGDLPWDDATTDLSPIFSELFLDNSTQFLLGVPLNLPSGSEKSAPVSTRAFLDAFYSSEKGIGIRLLLGRLRILAPKAKWLAAIKTTHRFIDYYIDQSINIQSGKKLSTTPGSSSKKARTLLENLILQTQDRVEIRHQILQGMMASQDTTSVLLSNTFFLLSRHPKIWARLRDEILLGDTEGFSFDSLKSLNIVQSILKESLRIYPVFPTMGRVALQDTTLPRGGGSDGSSPVFIAKGTRVTSSFYALHRDSLIYGSDTESFNPDRWDMIKPESWEYMPFGGGPRRCVGREKALAEAAFVLIKMAQTFRAIESRDDRDWAGVAKLTASNGNGCKVALIRA
ncbi:hypothetical protein ACMFMG_012149 [Clarireedia jacksonii]